MFSELDFSQWQSYLVVLIVVATFVLGIALSIASLFGMYWWIMGDIILFKRKLRKAIK